MKEFFYSFRKHDHYVTICVLGARFISKVDRNAVPCVTILVLAARFISEVIMAYDFPWENIKTPPKGLTVGSHA